MNSRHSLRAALLGGAVMVAWPALAAESDEAGAETAEAADDGSAQSASADAERSPPPARGRPRETRD